MERKTVVVVEDETDTMELLSAILTEEGYRVLQARDGKEGIDTVLNEKPDLVLMDVLLPGVLGAEAIRSLQGQAGLEKTKIVLMSSLKPGDFDDIFANRPEADAYLEKPFNPAHVIRVVESLLAPA